MLSSPNADLIRLLKRLKLGQMIETLSDRLTLARAQQLDYASFLEILLADEVARRDRHRLERRIRQAGFREVCRLEDFDWSAQVKLDRRMLQEVFRLEFLARHQHCLFVGPVGVGKTFLAQALGQSALRVGYSVIFTRADDLFRSLLQARADNSFEREFRRYLAPELLIVDDFGLQRLTNQQAADIYGLIVSRDRRSSCVFTSNRAIDEWLALFDDPILGNSALDRLANASYQIVIEGRSYRERLTPKVSREEVVV
jgi:DNA replication protein DnaC